MRYFSILDGASLTDEDVNEGSTSYYGYTRPGGSWVIMKYDPTAGTYGFRLGQDADLSLSTYNAAFTNRASESYLKAGNLKRL